MLPSETPHRRLNQLTGEWVLVSPHRLKRPWQGKQETVTPDTRPAFDPGCYLCPGNTRADGAFNPEYESTYVFTNDFAALLPDVTEDTLSSAELLQAEAERGICRVVCFSPRHDLSISRLDVPVIRHVIDTWAEEFTSLASAEFISYIQIFENKGEIMGCSNPHPHGQMWATSTVPDEPTKEDARQREYFERHGRTLLDDYAAAEEKTGERVVLANESWLAVVPFWAKWPYETLLVSRRPVKTINDLDSRERNDLADVLKRLTTRYDNLFQCPFPYTMGFHQAPVNGGSQEHWHLHAHFYPPLLRSATVQKFMVGFEMLGMPQRDLTAEHAAEKLAALPDKHYMES